MLEETSKKGIYRGYQQLSKEKVNGIEFEIGKSHHGNGNTNFVGTARFRSVGQMIHFLNIIQGRNWVEKAPDFSFDQNIHSVSQDPFAFNFRSREAIDQFKELVIAEKEEQDELRREREEAGIEEPVLVKFSK